VDLTSQAGIFVDSPKTEKSQSPKASAGVASKRRYRPNSNQWGQVYIEALPQYTEVDSLTQFSKSKAWHELLPYITPEYIPPRTYWAIENV